MATTTNQFESFQHHVIFAPMASWGHARPMVPIMFKMVQERPDILISIAVIGSFKDKMEKEIGRYCIGPHIVLKDNIRVIQLSDFEGPEMDSWANMVSLWTGFMDKLCACETITCFSGRIYPSAPRPRLCIADIFFGIMLETNLICGRGLKTLLWNSANTSCMWANIGPIEHGGNFDFSHAPDFAKEENISIQEAERRLFLGPLDAVKKLPGFPPVYRHEYIGDRALPPEILDMYIGGMKQMANFIKVCDGAVLNSTSIFEGEVNDAFKNWFKEMGKPCYTLGPCMILDEVASDQEELARGQDVVKYLNRIYESHGKHSLLYMSFGTVNFPDTETPWQLVDILLDMNIPLLFTIPFGDVYEKRIPNDLRNKLESSELALVAKWTPQQFVLEHPVTGAFLTHCGQGGITEALMASVVVIGWPLWADQPYNCVQLELGLKVAYRLHEVRTIVEPTYGGSKPTGTKEAIDREFRRVLKDALGADGAAKREVLKELSGKLRKAWKEDGEALIELRRLLQDNFE